MKGKVLGLIGLMICTFSSCPAYSEIIQYGFAKGATYSYKYSRQDSSSVTAPNFAPQKTSKSQSIDFSIKSIDYQDNAFILDIGNKDATYRRYLATNGSLKGSPAEDPDSLPFFPVFPTDDWRIGTINKQSTEILAFGKKIPAIWNLKLEKIDSMKSLAYISFGTSFNIAEDKTYTRKLSLKGNLIFNMAEGIIQQATWNTTYSSNQTCKEMAITRELWTFEKQTNHSLVVTGVKK